MDDRFQQAYADIGQDGYLDYGTKTLLIERLKEGITDEHVKLLPTLAYHLYPASHELLELLAVRMAADGITDRYAVNAVMSLVYAVYRFGDQRRFSVGEVKDEHALKDGHYKYIPHDHAYFVEEMAAMKPLLQGDPPTFIDVGSGIGDKVLLAYLLGYSATGIEYNAQTYEVSKRVLFFDHQLQPKVRLLQGDALCHRYNTYNMVYMYCPMMSRNRMLQLYTKILKELAVGSAMFEVLMHLDQLEKLADTFGFPPPPCYFGDSVVIHRVDTDSYRCGLWGHWQRKIYWTDEEPPVE